MDWLSNITVDTTIAIGFVVIAAALTFRWRKPAADVGRVVQKKLKTVKPASASVVTRKSASSRLSMELSALSRWWSTFVIFRRQEMSPSSLPYAPEGFASNRVEQISRTTQWNRVTGVVSRAIDGAGSVERWQQAAEDQLDAATYAINGLLDELLPVMPQSFSEMHNLEVMPAMVSRPKAKHAYRSADYKQRPTAAKLALAAHQAVAA